MEAVGIYFNRLVERQGLKVKTVAEQAKVKPGYISRLVSRDIQDPSARILRALTEAVSGSWEDVGALLDPRATREQAETLADAWYVQLMETNGAERDVLRRRLLSVVDSLLADQDRG